ncbi:gamma-glutamyl-gamma-aminobutyrate hydrolase family protein [Congregibacter litoralis]|uniref:Putative glutamine amidotransferase n=1 Tax=Congregibacter litoralis KT71 TaxID=314285 RepID=A4A8R4_9GAMM|nr:gamma-glutamyl-gamma-aminobutyrate hydrolase family protein [Congregibacter litoralis]EAQ97456.1 putative glutamine amidotransferase [Congregibacter litoralis KT71]
MAQRPRIAVTGNGRRWAPSWWCTRLALFLVGAQAVRISVRHTPPDEENFDAFIIGGGDDIGPEQYGEPSNPKIRSDPARDALEVRWIKQCLAEKIPVMGICRGAQLINVVLEGTLHQDIRDMRKHTRNRASLVATKEVKLLSGSRAEGIFATDRLKVNSLHHQAINSVSDSLAIVGRDRDNICQMVEGTGDKAIIGVQWHPEYLFYLPVQLRIFRWLVAQAKTA